MVACGSICNAAWWLKEPGSPWIAIRISAPQTYFDDTATHRDANAPKYSVARLYPQERHDALDNFSGAAGTLAGRLHWIPRGWRVYPYPADHCAGGPGYSADRWPTSH